MRGYNTLVLNQSEMIRALEYYLNSVQFKEPIKVESIIENKGNQEFEINISESTEGNLGTLSITDDPGMSIHG